MAPRLFNSLTRTVDEVRPIEPGHVRLYTCGPTVYARAHIGNFRSFVFEDVLRRWLERSFPRVSHVMNLTDVDDKIIRNAVAHGNELDAETAPWIAAFFEDLDCLNIRRAHHYPRATEYIGAMVDLVVQLEKSHHAYRSGSSVYFDVGSFPGYGKLTGIRQDELIAGASGRIDNDEYEKVAAADFALWKGVDDKSIGWDSALGRGRPGWHIECSAMSMALLGSTVDIHCGGVDNKFPHHENEIAQSESVTGVTFATMWCHGEHLRVSGEKMAKSTGNFVTIPDLIADGIDAATIRYLLAAAAHYRAPLNLTPDSLHMASEAVERWGSFARRVRDIPIGNTGDPGAEGRIAEVVERSEAAFSACLDDDLNLVEGMGVVFSGVREMNRALDATSAVPEGLKAWLLRFVDNVDDVLGVLPLLRDQDPGVPDPEVQRLLDLRQQARAEKRWADADRAREELSARGYLVEDTKAGQRVVRQGSRA